MLSEAKYLYRLFTTFRMTKSLLHLPFAFLLLTSYFSYSQSDVLKYARSIVDTLASPSMHGRGYVMKGDSIAADYIKKEFENLAVKPVGKEFYQRFSFQVNTFYSYDSTYFLISKVYSPFIGGKDFLISPSSHRTNHISDRLKKSLWLDSSSYYNKKTFRKFTRRLKDNYVFIDINKTSDKEIIASFNKKRNSCVLVFLKRSKLTWGISQTVDSIPSIQLFVGDSITKIKYLFKDEEPRAFIDINNLFIPNYRSQNVIGFIKGSQYPDSFLVFTAHYDHLGMMGKDVYFPGANDNASGCAMLLNLAKYYSEHKPKYSVAFMAFGAEEVGLLGSKYYIEHQLFNLNQIKFLINFDIVGTGDEGIKVVNATQHKKEFDELVKINEEKKYLSSIQPRGKASISDHYFFEEAGVKTFYIYTLGGIKAYHDIYDRPETLPLTKFEELYKLVIDFANGLQN